jgi:Ca2+-binding EF-hand superfamily protein
MKAVKRSLVILGAAVALGGLASPVFAGSEPAHARGIGPGHGGAGGWKAFDANEDGSVTAAEFLSEGTALAKELQSAFLEKYDSIPTGQTIGDGIVTTVEAKAVIQAHAAEHLAHLLEALDTNDDGALSSAELKGRRGPRVGGHLEELDANDDGALSAAELAAGVAAEVTERLEAFLEKFDSIPTGATAGDGNITGAESLALFENRVGDRIEEILTRYDANKDGSVSAAEIASRDQVRPAGRGGPGGRGKR